MKSKIFFFILSVMVLFSCTNTTSDPEFNYDKIVTKSDSAKTADTTKNQTQITIPQDQIQTTTVSAPANTATAKTGLNPEHGKPGHRCDIPVGAPLNSKPSTPSQQQTVSTKKTITPPGMNPPHGEPGHRCDIAVGAPLNQPAKTDTAQNIKTVSPIVNDSAKK